jgi:murein lipoprotein
MRGKMRALIGALVAGVAVGCASSGDMNSVKGDVAEARRIAEDANRKADAAAADAAAARSAAEAAAQDAREANEKADRIFQRSLHK